VTYLAREYVWGPGDWGVDELLAQYDADRRASWPLQDAGGDVIALCDRGGANGTARVITQIVYDAHGAVIDRDDPYGTAASAGKELRVGHKGLFFDRLDAGISDPVTGAETPRLWPGARLSGYARNRTLHCDFGRWNQPDPNMTGLPVQANLAYHGRGLSASVQGFELRAHFGNGANVYAYLGGSPLTKADALGLEYTYVNIQFTSSQQAGMQSAQWGQYGSIASAGSQYAGVSMSGALPGMGAGGAVGSLSFAGKFVAMVTAGALIITTTGEVFFAAHAGGIDGPAGEEPLPGEPGAGRTPSRIVRVSGDPGGSAFMAPDGTTYVGVQHLQVQQYLHQHGLWRSLGSPGEPGWYYGVLGANGQFKGSPI
jgi:hypothetical protein